MDTPTVSGQKRSSLYFNKVDIYSDRIEIKGLLLPKKVILRDEITSWTEINKKHKSANINWVEVTVYTNKTKYMINSLHWQNFNEMKEALTEGKTRDTAKEKKIYDSIW